MLDGWYNNQTNDSALTLSQPNPYNPYTLTSKLLSRLKPLLAALPFSFARCVCVPAYDPRFLLYSGAFGSILVIALLNPRSFEHILGRWASLCLNFSSGAMVALMAYVARQLARKACVTIGVRMADSVACVAMLAVCAYFGVAVVYDVAVSIPLPMTW